MKTPNRLKALARKLVAMGIAAGMVGGLTTALWSAEPKSDSTNNVPESKAAPKAETKKVQKLTGADLYAINCNRCHPERYPTEFNSAQWKTLMTHMRVRANLPAKQAKEILKYLQEESGN